MKRYRRYMRYFVAGFIFAALVFGSVALKAIYPASPAEPCHPYWGGPRCPDGPSLDREDKPICPKKDAACPPGRGEYCQPEESTPCPDSILDRHFDKVRPPNIQIPACR